MDASHHRDDHEEWSARAMSHVMGGLDAERSSEFRRHLLGCPRCKAQVKELRDLAGSLSLAARREQTARAIRVMWADEDADDGEDDDTPEPVGVSWRGLVVVIAVVLAIGLLVYDNLSLRGEVSGAQRDAQVVSGLGSGLVVDDVQRAGSVSGQVVADETSISWSFSDLPVPTAGEVVAVWLLPPDGAARLVPERLLSRPARDVVAGTVNDTEARRLVITLASADLVTPRAALDDLPGAQLVVADLGAVRVTADASSSAGAGGG